MNKQPILDPFSGVAASGIALTDMNKFLGSVLEKTTFILAGGSFTKSMIPLIEIKANGKAIFQTTGANVDLSNQYNGGYADATVIKLDLMDRKMRTVNGYQAGALDLSKKSGIISLRAELTIAGATTPAISGFCDVSPPTDNPVERGIRFLMTRRHRATYVVGAAGQYLAMPIPHLDPAGGGSVFRRIFFYSQYMTAFKTVREGNTEHDLTVAQNNAAQRDNGKIPQTNLTVFDPVQDGQIEGRLWDTRPRSGCRSAQFYASFSAAETITIETEELLPLAAY